MKSRSRVDLPFSKVAGSTYRVGMCDGISVTISAASGTASGMFKASGAVAFDRVFCAESFTTPMIESSAPPETLSVKYIEESVE